MKSKKILLAVAFFIATVGLFASNSYEAKAKDIYSHTVVSEGIAYHHYISIDDVTGHIDIYTVWVDQGGTVHKESGWRFPPPPPGKSAPQPNLSNEEALKNAMSGILSELNSKLESNPIIKDYKHLTLAAAESSLQITTTANEVYISNTTDGTASILDTRTGVIVRENIRITNTPTRVELPENCDRKGVYTVIFTGDNGKHSICNFYFIQGELEYQNQK